MKKLFYLLLLTPMLMQSQIEVISNGKTNPPVNVGKISNLGTKSVSLDSIDNAFTVSYKNMMYPSLNDWKSFTFLNTDNDIEKLYQMIIDGFENTPTSTITLKLLDSVIGIEFEKALGTTSVTFVQTDSGANIIVGKTQPMTKRQINKLFGKDK